MPGATSFKGHSELSGFLLLPDSINLLHKNSCCIRSFYVILDLCGILSAVRVLSRPESFMTPSKRWNCISVAENYRQRVQCLEHEDPQTTDERLSYMTPLKNWTIWCSKISPMQLICFRRQLSWRCVGNRVILMCIQTQCCGWLAWIWLHFKQFFFHCTINIEYYGENKILIKTRILLEANFKAVVLKIKMRL